MILRYQYVVSTVSIYSKGEKSSRFASQCERHQLCCIRQACQLVREASNQLGFSQSNQHVSNQCSSSRPTIEFFICMELGAKNCHETVEGKVIHDLK